MFVITNRSVDKSRTGLDQKPNNLTFDNVVLCKADTNNAGHPDWVDKIAHNRRISITINEDDFALRHSGIKPGNAQGARLGHYINSTDTSWVRNSHSPLADPVGKNEKLKTFFREAFTGQPAERPLRFFCGGELV
jgi:hypothetical protein